MIILEEPFVSQPLIDWLASSQHPVLDNPMAQALAAQGAALNVVGEAEAAKRIDAGERVLTNSENALAWILEHTHDVDLAHAIEVFKDKELTRRTLAPLDAEQFFAVHDFDQLKALDYANLPSRLVVKPNVGFCSMGVHMVESEEDWRQALASIEADRDRWNQMYPQSVIESDDYIVEGYIDGVEYALEAYYDAQGKAHLLNVCRHDFAGDQDMSDRLYVNSPALMRELGPSFEQWLDDVNELIGARNMPVHPEVRVNDTGIHVIEFNPLRFMGLGGTDLTFFAYGLRSCQAYLEDQAPDFEALFAGKDDACFATLMLNAPQGTPADATFDYEAFERDLLGGEVKVMDPRRFNYQDMGQFGFYLLDVTGASPETMQRLLTDDLKDYIRTEAR